jgi:hypothetical protein
MLLPTARQFVWFPAVAELAEYLGKEKMDRGLRLETALGRDDKTTRLEKPVEKFRVPPTQEEKDAVSRIVAGIPGTARHRSSKDAKAIASFRRFGNEEPEKPDNLTATTAAEVAEGVAGENAIRDRKARKDPDFAYTLERRRRMELADEAAKAAGGGPAKFWVPMHEPLHDALRAFYGHPCPGYDPPRPPTAAEMHEAAAERNPSGRIDTAVTDNATPKSRNIRPDATVVFEDVETAE